MGLLMNVKHLVEIEPAHKSKVLRESLPQCLYDFEQKLLQRKKQMVLWPVGN
jgi:hypothetical protein